MDIYTMQPKKNLKCFQVCYKCTWARIKTGGLTGFKD